MFGSMRTTCIMRIGGLITSPHFWRSSCHGEWFESRLKKAVVRAIERDGHINRKQLRKQHLARAKSRIRFRGRPQQANGDASEQASSQARRRPRSQNQLAPGGVTMESPQVRCSRRFM